MANQSARLLCGYLYASAGHGESTQDMVFAGHDLIAENGIILAENAPFDGGCAETEIDCQRMEAERARNTSFELSGEGYQTVEFDLQPVETTLTLIGDKWKVLILRDLMPGTKRFGELRKSVGDVSQKVLAAQLRDMEKSGLVHREVYAEVPPRVEYTLTDLGRSLKPILDAMQSWGEAYKAGSAG